MKKAKTTTVVGLTLFLFLLVLVSAAAAASAWIETMLLPSSLVIQRTFTKSQWMTPKMMMIRQGLFFGSSSTTTTTRMILRHSGICWMGSTSDITPGEVHVYNEQETLELDLNSLEETISTIRSELGYPNYSVTLVLVEDEEMQDTNMETRGVDAPTDILSFPFHPHITPGQLQPPEFEIPDLYTLGDMMLDVPYVIRRCQEDELLEQDEERGVSGAMANVMDPEKRIHMLMVHGMLHLVGYDHIEDDDYELMVTREEELLDKLGL